jgi:hypothetical protein
MSSPLPSHRPSAHTRGVVSARLAGRVDADRLGAWFSRDRAGAEAAWGQLEALEPQLEILRRSAGDWALETSVAQAAWSLPDLSIGIEHLRSFLADSLRPFAILRFGGRQRAAAVVERLGSELSIASAERALSFLEVVRARKLIGDLTSRLPSPPSTQLSFLRTLEIIEEHQAILGALLAAGGDREGSALAA